MSFSAETFKAHFPLFSQAENHALVYLDNAATTQTPHAVIDAVSDFYLHCNANAHRASHRLARKATEMQENTRIKLARYLQADRPEEIVFCSGATAALNLLAYSLCRHLQTGDEIVLSRAEHHANLVPWQMMAERLKLQLRFIPDNNGVPCIERASEVIGKKTRVVSISAASNALGFINDIKQLATQIDSQQTRLVVDGSQLLAHHMVNLADMPCDFFVCSAHKFYGPTGIGILYGKWQHLSQMPPWQGGGEMITHTGLYRSDYASPPHRFEAGTASLAAISGLSATIDFLARQDRQRMQQHEHELCHYLHQSLRELDFIRLLSHEHGNIGIAAFTGSAQWQASPFDIASFLDEQDIAVRAGHHCAQPLMQACDINSMLRVSLAAYNTRDDIDQLLTALKHCYKSNSPAKKVANDDLSGLDIAILTQQAFQQRHKTLMQWGDRICKKPDIRSDDYRIQGCESQLWMKHQHINDRHVFLIDSDSRIIRGLAALLLSQLNNKTSNEIMAADMEDLFEHLQLGKYLSASRQNGLAALLAAIRDKATRALSKPAPDG